jgi:ABC-2 type transport system permease protein
MSGLLRGGSFLWLLGFEIKLALRGMFGRAKSHRWAWIALLVFLVPPMLFVGWLVAQGLGHVPPSLGAVPDQVVVLISFVLLALSTIMLSHALYAVTEIVYVRNDLDLLLSSPVSPWSVTLARTVGVAVNVALLYLALLMAVLVWTPFVGGWQWFRLLPILLALALFVTGLGMLIALGLFTWIGPRHTRLVSQILAGLIGAALFLGSQLARFVPDMQGDALLAQIARVMEQIDVQAWNPVWFPALAVLGHGYALVGWVAIGALFFVAAAGLFSRRLVAAAAASAGDSRKKGSQGRKLTPFRGGLTLGIVRKEWTQLRRDPLLIGQTFMQMVYLLPLFLPAFSYAAGRQEAINTSLLAASFTFLTSTLAGTLIWITASAEDAPDLVAAAPVRQFTVELAKLVAAVLPVLVLMIAPAVAFGLQDWPDGVLAFTGFVGAGVCAGLIGVWYTRPGNRREFRRARGGSFGVALGTLCNAALWAAFTGLALSDWRVWCVIPLVFIGGLMMVLEDGRTRHDAARVAAKAA